MTNSIDIVDGAFLRTVGPIDAPTLILLAGFPDNGYLFEPLFSCELAKRYHLVTVDLWGFGASPRRDGVNTAAQHAHALSELIENYIPKGRAVGLVGHSIAATICVKTAAILGDKISGLFSIEGNLTPDDAFFTGKAANYDDPHEFKREFLKQVWERGQSSDTYRRYYAGAVVANAMAMWRLGCDAKRISVGNELGQSYKDMAQPSLYYWSKESTPKATRKWIERSGINNQIYTGAGHWPSLDKPKETANAIAAFFDKVFTG